MNQMKENKSVVTMKTLPSSEQPYELLEEKGEAALTDAQLLAIVLKTGTAGESALGLAMRLLANMPQKDDPLGELLRQPLRTLKEYRGIGRVKAIQLKALAELAKRLSHQGAKERILVEDPETLVSMYQAEMRALTREVIKLVFFNAKNHLLGDMILSMGTMTESLINPREVFIAVWQRNAYSFVLLHNHPSGDPTPSLNDILVTDRLRSASRIMGIPMLDHIIIGENRFFSFKEQKKIIDNTVD